MTKPAIFPIYRREEEQELLGIMRVHAQIFGE